MKTIERPSIENDLTRRSFLTGTGSLLLLGASGCSDGRSDNGESSEDIRTIEHKYGSTEISGRPSRVVTVGLTDQDPVLALGVRPVGVMDWYGDYPTATWPWASDRFGDARPEMVGESTAVNFESVAALEPDLILALYSGITKDEYETLSQITPTVAPLKDYPDFGAPWQEMTLIIGRALGRRERAEEAVASVEDRYEDVRRAHPEFDGASAVYAGVTDPGNYYVESSGSTRTAILTSMGFEVPEEIDQISGDQFYTDISRERLDLLEADVLVWEVGDRGGDLRESIEDDVLYRQLTVSKEGRDVFITDELVATAMAWSTVLSLPLVIDALVPQLAAAMDGDPATKVSETNS